MSYDLTNIRFYKPVNSIVTNGNDQGDDKNKPFTYTEWLTHVNEDANPENGMSGEYNKYVDEWNKTKQSDRNVLTNRQRYRTLLKNIALSYTTTEEKRFLSNLDYTNYRHVESACSFFASKIKKISTYYADQRQYIKHSKKQYHTLGTTTSITDQVRNEIPKLYEELQIRGDQQLVIETERLDGVTIVSIEQLYDIETPKPTDNAITFDPDIFLDFEKSIENLLIECTPVLVLSDNLTFMMTGGLEVNQQNIEQLDYENFYNYEKKQSRLNINLQPEYISSLVGADLMYLSAGEIQPMLEANKPWRNVLQRGNASIHSLFESKTKSISQLGSMALPQSLGVLTYYSHQPELQILDTQLNGVVSDPYKYGPSVYSGTTNNAIDHKEDITWLKADISNDGLFGDIIDSDRLPKFFGYTSETESRFSSYVGVSKQSDPYGFFRGEKNLDWANPDVFPEPPASNIYEIDSRQETLLTGSETVTRWSTDVHGNEYALLKNVVPLKDPEEFVEGELPDEFVVTSTCQVIDGGNTMRDRPPLWTDLVDYNIFDGGRKGGYDPKIEQALTMKPFEDLRRQITVVTDDNQILTVLEDHNTWYMGPDAARQNLELTQITYHGFIYRGQQPVYDQQAYCGRFTDLGCGRINPNSQQCIVRDSYAFGTFTEPRVEIDGQTYYISQSRPDADIVQDAYEVYYNSDYDQIDFTNYSDDPEMKIYENDPLDGGAYSTQFCEEFGAEIVYNESVVQFFNDSQDVSVTELATQEQEILAPINAYEEDRLSSGRLVFRSYNGKVIADLHEVMSIIFDDFVHFKGSSREIVANQIRNDQIQDMDVFYDVIVIQTETHLMIQKMNFDETTGSMRKSNLPDVLMKTNDPESPIEVNVKWCYNPKKYELICGYTNSFASAGKTYVHPVLFRVDLNNMQIAQMYPNKEHVDHDEQMYILQGNFTDYQVEHVDKPIVCFNDKTDVYTLSYSCKLSGETDVCFGFCISDYELRGDTFRALGVDLHHTTPVPRYADKSEEWEQTRSVERLIRFPQQSIPTPSTTDMTTYRMSLSSTQQEPIQDFEMILTVELAGLPTTRAVAAEPAETGVFTFELSGGGTSGEVALQSINLGSIQPITMTGRLDEVTGEAMTLSELAAEHEARVVFGDGDQIPSTNTTFTLAGGVDGVQAKKINRIIFDPGDGGDMQYVDRRISTGLEDIDYDINKLPDQSDFDDPRRLNLKHNYMFNDGSQQFYTASLTAVYANYKKLIVDIDIETLPYSIESAFGTVRLIDTKTYLDNLGSSKQLLVLETESPRYVSHVTIEKSSYNNGAVVGFVDGSPYSAEYHMMSDGRLMTGGGHSPSSRYITSTP